MMSDFFLGGGAKMTPKYQTILMDLPYCEEIVMKTEVVAQMTKDST